VSEPRGSADRSAHALYALIGGAAHVAVATAAALRGSSTWLDERLGRYASRSGEADGRPSIWVHAASVGEVRAVEALVRRLEARLGSEHRIVLTCQTATGRDLASRAGVDEARFAPLDSERAVARALAHFKPALFVLVET
jgi:3-deoxy-D-manno-octulosonic-acid transferase